MRVTITLAQDAAAAVERVQRQNQLSASEAVNHLIRLGVAPVWARPKPYVHRCSPIGVQWQGHDLVAALESLDDPRPSI